ncbi:ATP-grasp domain-containing protein [Magnetovibrio sp.]|uniref:ATP-grasp domain-containing protein n=1 Tax=Magnetovibrio sp. TaxID=2024836 RepID=UPI002F93296F
MSRALLMVGGGVQAVPGIRMAKDMGLFVAVSDRNPNAPGFAYADAKLIADTYSVEQTTAEAVKFHREQRLLDGVMCMATDVPHTVAGVAEALGLPTIGSATANLAINKLAMKQKFRNDGVAIPWFDEVSDAAHLAAIVAERGLPLVIKPIDSRGSRGVLRLTQDIDLDWAFATSKEQSPTGRVMAESYMSGPQVSTESVVVDGVAYTPGFSDRNYELLDTYAPYMIENGGDLPSFLDAEAQAAICRVVQDAADSLGVRNGIVKGDMVYSDGKAYVIELAARLSGGFFCTHEIPLNTGVSTVEAAIKLAMGDRIDVQDLKPKFQRPVVQRYLFVPPGRVTSVSGIEQAADVKGVEFVDCWVKPGDEIIRPIHSGCTAAVVIATGDTHAQALSRTQQALNHIQVVTDT